MDPDGTRDRALSDRIRDHLWERGATSPLEISQALDVPIGDVLRVTAEGFTRRGAPAPVPVAQPPATPSLGYRGRERSRRGR